MAINSKRKGKNGELELSKKLRDYGFADCRRSVQYCGANGDADVVGLEGIHIECKRVQALNLTKAITQASEDAKNGEIPTVFHRKDNEKWLVTMYLSDWIEFYKESGLIERGGK